jgi:hypothetical protein
MKTGLLAALAVVGSLGAADPPGVVIEVDAGKHERRNTPIFVPLPERLQKAVFLAAESLDDHTVLPGQLTATLGREPVGVFILRGTLPAGSKRRYRLTAAGEKVIADGAGYADTGKAEVLSLGGRPFLTYHDAVLDPPKGIEPVYRRSGFIHPLTTRAGLVVTDDFPPEHAHQHGLFFAWVNTTFEGRPVDFWNQAKRTGDVRHTGSPGFGRGPVAAEFTANLAHDALNSQSGPTRVLNEVWNVRVYDVPGYVVADVESVQTCAGDKALTINKYHYGGFGVRGSRRWSDRTAKGNDPPDQAKSGHSDFLTSEGKHRADGNHTRPRWVDLSGEADERGHVAGVTVFDHPGNFRFPQPVRLHPNMPYFCFAPMVLGEFEIAPGRPYVSRYRVVAHDGPPDKEAIERLWNDYADPPVVRVVEGGR